MGYKVNEFAYEILYKPQNFITFYLCTTCTHIINIIEGF